MARRRLKRIVGGILVLAGILGLGLLLLYWRLPMIVERRVIDALTSQGLHDVRIEVGSVGLSQTEFGDLRALADVWRLELALGRAQYRTAEAVRGRIESLELDGLTVAFDTLPALARSDPDPSHLPGPLLAGVPSQLPIRRAIASNGRLRWRGPGQAPPIPFTGWLAADPNSASFAARLNLRSGPDQLRIDAQVRPAGHTRISTAFNVRDPALWLRLLSSDPAHAVLRLADAAEWGPFAGTVDFDVSPGALEADLTGAIEGMRVAWANDRITTGPIAGNARLGYGGLSELHLESAVEWVIYPGTRLAARLVSVELLDRKRLRAQVSNLEFQVPQSLNARGDLQLEVQDARAGAEAALALAFQVQHLSLPGAGIGPFQGDLRGNRQRLAFTLPEVTIPIHGRWRVRMVEGELANPTGDRRELRLRGQVDGAWSTNLLVMEPLPFTLHLDQRAQSLRASLSAPVAHVIVPALAILDDAPLAGEIGLTAELEPNQLGFRVTLNLGCPKAAWIGASVTRGTVKGQIALRNAVSPFAPLAPWLKGWLDQGLHRAPGGFEPHEVDVELRADGITLAPHVTLKDTTFRLRGTPPGPPASDHRLGFQAHVASVEWNGLRWVGLDCAGYLDGDGVQLELALAQLEWPGQQLALQDVRTTVSVTGLDPWLVSTPGGVAVGRMRWAEHEWTDLSAHLETDTDQRLHLEVRPIPWLGGRVRVAPCLYDQATDDLRFELHLDGVDLAQVAQRIPGFLGTLSGRVSGRLPVVREAGRWRMAAGLLELDRGVPARLQYPADGLLTGGLQPDSARYRQLRWVEEGLQDLQLQALTVSVDGPTALATVLRVRLEGLSLSSRASVPVILNLNVQGDFDQLLRLLERGQREFSW